MLEEREGPIITERRFSQRSPYENERTLDFSVLAGVRPRVETMPLERAPDAYRRMRSGDVEFRMVLTMGEAR